MKKLLKRIPDSAGAWLLDAASALLLCWALCLVLFPLWGFVPTTLQAAGMAAASVLLAVLLSRKRVLAAAGILLLLALLAALVLRLGFEPFFRRLWTAAAAPVSALWGWISAGLPESEVFSPLVEHGWLGVLFLLPAAAVCLLFFRRLYAFLPLALLCAAGVVYTQLMDTPQQYAVAAILLVLALTSMAKTTHREQQRRLPEGTVLPESAMRAAALLFASLVVLISVRVASAPDGKWTSRAMHVFVSDTRDVVRYLLGEEGSVRGGPGYGGGENVVGYGAELLGGDRESDIRVLYRVQTDTPTLLRTGVYDSYSGRGWYDAEDAGAFRLDSPAWVSKRHAAFASGDPRGGRRAREFYELVTREAELRIRTEQSCSEYLLAGTPVEWTFDEGCPEAYFSEQGELFPGYESGRPVSYTVRSVIFLSSDRDFELNLRRLEPVTSASRDPLFAGIVRQYTALPDSLPSRVRDTAQRIVSGAETPVGKAFALLNWLHQNCSYTLTPGDVPAGQDFVDWFLQTREGYCTYYASAMTVMARCAGLPARYVTGFGMKLNPGQSGGYVITDESAHAWCEVYFNGVGWVPFDPMGFVMDEHAALPEDENPKEPEDPTRLGFLAPTDLDELLDGQGGENPLKLDGKETDKDAAGGDRLGRLFWLVLTLLALAFLLLVLLRIRWLRADGRTLLVRLRRLPDAGTRAERLFSRILQQLEHLNLGPYSGETLQVYGDRIGRRLGEVECASAFAVMDRLYYGLRQPGTEEIENMAALSAALERLLPERMGSGDYFRRRVLWDLLRAVLRRRKKDTAE